MASDYPHNSPYAFSENVVISHVELEGLKKYYAADGNFIGAVGTSTEIRVMYDDGEGIEFSSIRQTIQNANDMNLPSNERSMYSSILKKRSEHAYSSADEAATSFARSYNVESYRRNKEMSSKIFKVSLTNEDGSKENVFILTPLLVGGMDTIDPDKMTGKVNVLGSEVSIDMPGTEAGMVHTQGRGDTNFSTYDPFNGGDKQIAEDSKLPVYLSNKDGELKIYDGKTKDEKTLRKDIPRIDIWTNEVTRRFLRK